MTNGVVVGVSVAHRHAALADIEVLTSGDPERRLEQLLAADPVSEAFVLETCNRAEAYVVAPTHEDGRTALREELVALDSVDARWLPHDAALEHLLRVGAGLESMIVGEDEILGQLQTARDLAEGTDALGPVLTEVVPKAVRVGERVRTETPINEGALSLGRAAVNAAAEQARLAGCTAVVVGAGDMGEIVARTLADRDVERIVVCNRTRSRAASLADSLDADATARDLSALAEVTVAADLIVTATGSTDPILEPDTVAAADDMVVVDIAQPRDVAPAVGELPAIELLDLEDVELRVAAAERRRVEAAEAAEEIVETELERLDAQLKRKQADAVIRQMYEGAMAIKRREVETAMAKLDAHGDPDDRQREIVESMAEAIVGQIMAAPTKSLRDAAEQEEWETLQTALQLFDPNFRSGAVSSSGDGPPSASTQVVEDTDSAKY